MSPADKSENDNLDQFFARYSYVLKSLYRSILHIDASSDVIEGNLKQIREQNLSLESVINDFLNSPQRLSIEKSRLDLLVDHQFHTPGSLENGSRRTGRALLLGSCMMDNWKNVIKSEFEIDHIPLNNFPVLPEAPPAGVDAYDFQIVQLPLRSVIPDSAYIGINYHDPKAFTDLFDRTLPIIELMIEKNLKWNIESGLLTFVCNFMTPQQNFMGRFGPYEDLRNPIFFVEKLNFELNKIVAKHKNAFILDIEKISRIYGKKYVQEDAYLWLTHQGLAGDYDDDRHRIEPPIRYTQLHPTTSRAFIWAMWNEAVAMHKSISGTDSIKLVIIDLDDTLWRGIAAEGALENFGSLTLEGWPLGFIEALHWLKSRGIILAIASKNNEETVRSLWPAMTRDLISLDDFAAHAINWNSKADNVRQIMASLNILPKNTLFIDDNPVERDAVSTAFPEIRTLGQNLYDIRRVLLWAPELQLPFISEESSQKTQMLKAQIQRESERTKFNRDDFLKSLNLEVGINIIAGVDDASFSRCFELLNKTNQFNTTGKKWKLEEISKFFSAGGKFIAASASDKFTNYGIISVLSILEDNIEQFVMSCRVFGLDIEFAILSFTVDMMFNEKINPIKANSIDTEYNLSSRSVYENYGFVFQNGCWILDNKANLPTPPNHIAVRY